jgi:hypothetical protein
LIHQTVVIALIQALVVSFFLAAAATNNGLVVIGVGLLCLVFMAMLLWSGFKAIWRSFNRLFDAFGKATGGAVITVGAAAQTAASTGAVAAAGGMALVGNTLGGASALANGASWAQAAGISLGGSQTLTGAARTLTRLPGLRDTELAEVADHFVEGAMTRQVARQVPLVGRVTGPVAGAALLTDRNPENAYAEEQGRFAQPMLIPAVGEALAGLARGPRWQQPKGETAPQETGQEGEFTPLRSPRLGRFTPVAPLPDAPEVVSEIESAAQRSDSVEQETGEEMEQHITEVAQETGDKTSGMRQGETARLDGVGNRLEQAADSLERAARALPVEGHLQVAGAANVASAMGDAVSLIQVGRDTGSLQGVEHSTVAQALASALGVTPVENGKPPIESDLSRFGIFANQALALGLNGEQVERVAREVKESPEGGLQPETRSSLVETVRDRQHLSGEDAHREVDRLEHTARLLPDEISAYGRVNVPSQPPEIRVTPQIQVTVEGGTGDKEENTVREDVLAGSAPLTGAAAGGEA